MSGGEDTKPKAHPLLSADKFSQESRLKDKLGVTDHCSETQFRKLFYQEPE